MKKLKNGKTIGIVTASLAAVSLFGVGFSAWVISGTKGDTTKDINVTVAEIQDKRITLALTSSPVDGSLVFDSATNDNDGDITTAAGSQTPSLSFSVNYTVTLGNGVKDSDFAVKAKWVLGDNSSALSDAITNNYLESPLSTTDTQISTKDGLNLNYTVPTGETTETKISTTVTTSDSSDSKVYTMKTTFYFAWGAKTEHKNPSLYDDNTDHTNAALTALKELRKANGAKFTIVLTPELSAGTK